MVRDGAAMGWWGCGGLRRGIDSGWNNERMLLHVESQISQQGKADKSKSFSPNLSESIIE